MSATVGRRERSQKLAPVRVISAAEKSANRGKNENFAAFKGRGAVFLTRWLEPASWLRLVYFDCHYNCLDRVECDLNIRGHDN